MNFVVDILTSSVHPPSDEDSLVPDSVSNTANELSVASLELFTSGDVSLLLEPVTFSTASKNSTTELLEDDGKTLDLMIKRLVFFIFTTFLIRWWYSSGHQYCCTSCVLRVMT